MKRFLWALFLVIPLAQAEVTAHAGESLAPARRGYAMDNPGVLLKQRIFGLAHGVHLLLSACLDKGENGVAAQQAYDRWYAAQGKVLDGVRGELAAYHFGVQAEQARWQDIARALGLKETIYPSLGDVDLQKACATLPQALSQSRYDFAGQLEIADDPAVR